MCIYVGWSERVHDVWIFSNSDLYVLEKIKWATVSGPDKDHQWPQPTQCNCWGSCLPAATVSNESISTAKEFYFQALQSKNDSGTCIQPTEE